MARRFRPLIQFLVIALVLGVALQADRQGGQQQQQSQQTPPDQPPPQPTFKTGINFVRVDVIITDKNGGTVADLQPGDFDVTEDGKPQKIETFKLVKLDGGTTEALKEPPKPIRSDFDEESEAARDDVRLFAIFLDDYHVKRGASMGVRTPIEKFIETQLGPSDMIGIMYPLEQLANVRMTRDHAAVEKAVERFMGRKFDYTPRNEFEEQYANYPAETVEQIRNQVSMTAIRGLITHMGSLKEGRKALILVSEGYSNVLPPQLRNPVATLPGFGNPNYSNPMAGAGDPNEDRAQFFGNMDLQQDLREIYDTANKNNVAIYTVDPRGLAATEFDIDQNVNMETDRQYLGSTMDSLRVLADQSDGRAIVNRNDLGNAMKQVVRDTSAYYLLGYSSSQAPSDGKFHEIKVRVKRPGVQIRSRKGYWALTAEETAKATAKPKPGPPKAVTEALAAVNRPSRADVVRTWIGTSRGDNGKTKITFVWEPVAKPAGDRGGATEPPQRVSLMALAVDGSPVFRGKVEGESALAANGSQGANGSQSSSNGSLHSNGSNGSGSVSATMQRGGRVTFEAPPGTIQLRVSVEGAGSQVLDSETRELKVPDLTAPQALGTPAVYRARTVRDVQQIKTDPNATPTASREFSRTDRLVIRVPAYAAGGSAPAITARLLNRSGAPMSDVPVAAASGDAQLDLPLAGLAPGEYILEIKAGAGDTDPKELVGFRVTG